jgi:hypothetical protein
LRDDARKKWPLKGSKHADNIMSQIIGFRFQVSAQPLSAEAPCLIEKETLAMSFHIRFQYLATRFPDTPGPDLTLYESGR